MLKTILQWLYWYPFRTFAQTLSFRYLYGIGKVSGIILSHFFAGKKRLFRQELERNFSGSLPGLDPDKTIQNTFINKLQTELEVLIFPRLNSANIASVIKYRGLEHLDTALSKGKGVMLLFSHFGANQMIMPAIGYKGYTMNQLSAPPMVWVEKLPHKKFSMIEKKALSIRWEHELSLPVKHINIFGSLKDALLCLKRNEILGIAIDGGGGKERIEVDFLGRKALFSTGALEIAVRTGCAVLPVFMVRDKKGFNTIIFPGDLKRTLLSQKFLDEQNEQRNGQPLEMIMLPNDLWSKESGYRTLSRAGKGMSSIFSMALSVSLWVT
ncbi:MAG: lysophospholipid acyltransferase family protein [Nitrospirae bacterium]|nr:lysophospholipid acyltransferase family protein [Nitrospirota bacterium]